MLHLCGVNSDTVGAFADRLQKGTTGFVSVRPSGRMKRLDSQGTDFVNTVYLLDLLLYTCRNIQIVITIGQN